MSTDLRNPKGGLSEKGRIYFHRKQGVKGRRFLERYRGSKSA